MLDPKSDRSDSKNFTLRSETYTSHPRSRTRAEGKPAGREPARIPRVLVVDDYADTRAILLDVLVSHGCRVETAENGLEALDKARTWRPDIVILDLAMPGIDGFDVARRLKEEPATRDLPIVAYTAYTDPAWRTRAEGTGFAAFLIKPTPPKELVSTLRAFLPPEARPMTWQGAPNPDDTWTRLAPLRQSYESALPLRVHRLAQSWQELREARAVDEVRAEALTLELHRLRSLGASCGFPEVSRTAEKIEEVLGVWRGRPSVGNRAAVDRRMEELRQAALRWGGKT